MTAPDLKLLESKLKASLARVDRYYGRLTRQEAIASLGPGWSPGASAESKGTKGASLRFEHWQNRETGQTAVLETQTIAGRESTCRVYGEGDGSNRNVVLHLSPFVSAAVRVLSKSFAKSQTAIVEQLAASINWQQQLETLMAKLEAEQRERLAPLFTPAPDPTRGEADA